MKHCIYKYLYKYLQSAVLPSLQFKKTIMQEYEFMCCDAHLFSYFSNIFSRVQSQSNTCSTKSNIIRLICFGLWPSAGSFVSLIKFLFMLFFFFKYQIFEATVLQTFHLISTLHVAGEMICCVTRQNRHSALCCPAIGYSVKTFLKDRWL